MTAAPESSRAGTGGEIARILTVSDLTVAAAALDNGETVIVPTARWYMICCDASSAAACAAVYAAKRRPAAKSLLFALAAAWPVRQTFDVGDGADVLMRNFWPGDLALLLPWASAGQALASVGADAAMVCRPPGVLGALADHASVPVAATSANFSGTPGEGGSRPALTPVQAADFARASGLAPAVLVDGGICPHNVHLTVADCSAPAGQPRIVREGVVHRDAIMAALAADDQGSAAWPGR